MNAEMKTPAGGPGRQSMGSGSLEGLSPAQVLLSRLDKVKRVAPDRWMACCPAHEDRTPSLSVRECSDGTLLVHDFGGCAIADVLAAVGLCLGDLYGDDWRRHGSGPRASWQRDQWQAALDHEELVLSLARQDEARGVLTPENRKRAAQARARIRLLRERIHGR